MKIYWSDRDGNSPPLNAKFTFYPFSSINPSAPLIEQQRELPPPHSYKVVKRTFLPNFETWGDNVTKALQCIERKELQKVVLARACTLELEEAADPFAITAALKQKAQGAFVFCLHAQESSFLGASPERLFARQNGQIITEAVAGTRPRGEAEEEDLLSSAKDHLEFSFVTSYLKNALSHLCKNAPTFTPITIHKTHNVQHLYSQSLGTLKEFTTDEEILRALHPTPALCGTPKQKAFSLIRELEPFERGLYGGAIGWSTPESSEWVVGIRSCLVQGKTVTLFSGAGIVEGSDPKKEWDELNQKLKLYDSIFQLDH